MKMAIILVISIHFIFKGYSLIVEDECELHGCDSTWINDTLCDKYCQYQSCNYDSDDFHSECIDFNNDNSFCQVTNGLFQYAYGATTNTGSVEATCTVWPAMLSLGLYAPALNETCATLFDTFDTNNDNLLSIHEFVVWAALSFARNISIQRAQQIDCGCCETCNQDTNTTSSPTATLTTMQPTTTTRVGVHVITTSVTRELPDLFDHDGTLNYSFHSFVYCSIFSFLYLFLYSIIKFESHDRYYIVFV
eukprot:316955_1